MAETNSIPIPGLPQEGDAAPEPVSPRQLEKVREIVLCFANAVSSLKVFPPEHQTVKQFVMDLTLKMTSYLKVHDQLDIAVKEFSFVFADKPVYRDTTVSKSLPFFFFRDGLQTLTFYEGLDRAEIQDFLEMIREEFMKPQEDADIVAALWEKDFSNIHFFAPNDFLEAKIIEKHARSSPNPAGKEVLEIKVDETHMTEGRILLTDEDRRRAEYDAMNRDESPDTPRLDPPGQAEPRGDVPLPSLDPQAEEEDQKAVERLLQENRAVDPDKEFIELMIELLNMQTDTREFQSALDSLVKFNLEQILNRNFKAAIMLIGKIRDLYDALGDRDPGKISRLNNFLESITSDNTLSAMKDLVQRKALDSSLDEFINYMIILGSDALPLAADFYESVQAEEVRWRLENFFMDSAGKDPAVLVALANDRRTEFSKEVIRMLGRQPDKKAIPQFARFLGFSSSEIKCAAVKALGEIRDELADKILAGFLSDRDATVRIQAARKIHRLSDSSLLARMINRVRGKAFRMLSLEEKTAVLELLGRTGSPECLKVLRKLVGKRGFFSSQPRLEIRLAAVSGLSVCPAPESAEIIRKARKSRNKRIREAAEHIPESPQDRA